MTHGWPGSVIELLGTIGPLTDPTAHGGSAEDAFDLVLPSIPGYGFSAQPTELGWNPGRVARRLGGADEPPRLRPLRRPGRRRGRQRHRRDGAPSRPTGCSASTPTCWRRSRPRWPRCCSAARRCRTGSPTEERAAFADVRRDLQARLPRGEHRAPADDRLRPGGFARRAGGLDARPRRGQLRQDRARLPRRAAHGRPHAGEHRRQRHAVLADQHRRPRRRGSTGSPDERTIAAAGQAPADVALPAAFTVFPGELFRRPRAGWSRSTPTSSTSTRPRRAATSPPGKSRSSSPRRCAPRSGRCADDVIHRLRPPSLGGAIQWLAAKPLGPRQVTALGGAMERGDGARPHGVHTLNGHGAARWATRSTEARPASPG